MVQQCSQVFTGNTNRIARVMCESAAGSITIGGGSEHCSQEQRKPVGPVVAVERLCGKINGISRDSRHGTDRLELEVVFSSDLKQDVFVSEDVQIEAFIEEPDEWSDCACGAAVFCSTKQKCTSAFPVAQVDIVAKRSAEDSSVGREC